MRFYSIFIICLCGILFSAGCANKDIAAISANEDAQQLYQRASQALENAQFETAIQFFQTLEARYPFSPYALQTQLDLAYAYLRFGEIERAVAEADRFIRFNPTHPNVDYAYYVKGLANFSNRKNFLDRWVKRNPADYDQKKLHDSYLDFAILLNRFPDSQYAPDARQRMIFLRNEMADHEVSVANYYMQRKAWVAAANRANGVLQNYSDSEATEAALVILVKAYRALELEESANDALSVLALNFPNNPLVQENSGVEDGQGKS